MEGLVLNFSCNFFVMNFWYYTENLEENCNKQVRNDDACYNAAATHDFCNRFAPHTETARRAFEGDL